MPTALVQPYRSLFSLRENLPSTYRTEHSRRLNLSQLLHQPLDRVNVLGEEGGSYGHTGCVNALSWAHNGELLLSGGDDTTVRLWRMDSANTEQEYPFICRAVISTGHQGNIFNAQILPYSSRLVTVAADKQIRVSDLTAALSSGAPDGVEIQYSTRQCSTQVLRCHGDRVKRIVTEDSPALFLTVAEDGTVRQHDLRTPHHCRRNTCPTPLLKLNHDLSTLSLSTLTPYQFVVAGESPYGYLFDRRNIGRRMEEEWGLQASYTDEVTTCVRRFGRPPKKEKKKRFPRDHITGSRMSNYNGHEVLLCKSCTQAVYLTYSDEEYGVAYSGDAVYLFSALDELAEKEPSSTFASTSDSPSTADAGRRKLSQKQDSSQASWDDWKATEEPDGTGAEMELEGQDDRSESSKEDEIEDAEAAELELNYRPGVPVIMPRRRFVGARNTETVKDVNFLGPNDELVVSGSDDGNFFMWNKSTANLDGIYEADGNVVNVVESHPSLPLLAVSGIDTTIKLFAPSKGYSNSSRLWNAEQIVKENSRPVQALDLRSLLAEAMFRSGSSAECIHQ